MKFGVRKPSIKRSISARTTGKLKRTVNRTINPLYGKKGMGYINDPKKAVYNKVYNETTVGVSDLLKSKEKETYQIQEVDYFATIDECKEKASYYKILAVVWAIAFAIMIAFLGVISLFIGIIGTILFWNIGKAKANSAKELETELSQRSYNHSSNVNSHKTAHNSTHQHQMTDVAFSSSHKSYGTTDVETTYKTSNASNMTTQSVSFDTVLVYNGSEKMQWEIQQVHKGDKLEFEIDDEDRYLVSTKASYDVGYLHKRISDKINELINEGYEIVDGEITDIFQNTGKFNVKIHIILDNKN